ncbi:MAG: hypothetical protein PHR71_08925 [Polaromonas sp.]|nr:hypothetical protein [Polaromonas sp.]
MNSLSRTRLAIFVVMLGCCASASADELTQPARSTSSPVVAKVGHAIERGAKAAASGVKKGVTAGAHGVERGARAAASGVERGAQATGRAARTVARKLGITPASSPAAGN